MTTTPTGYCHHCGVILVDRRPDALYCSTRCRQNANTRLRRELVRKAREAGL